MKKDLEDIISEIENKCFSDPWSRENIRLMLNSEFDNILTIDDYAYINYRFMYDEAELMRIAVLPDKRKQGFANILMNKMLQNLRENNISKCLLEVRASNIGAISLYEKYKFKLIGKRKDYYTNPIEDALIMLLEI